MRKVVLQNWMALDLFTVAQGGTSAILHTECCVYTPYNSHNVSQTLATVGNEITHISTLTVNSVTFWWNSLGSWWSHIPVSILSL